MPSGKVHDRVTKWCIPWVGLATQIMTRHWGYTLLVVLGFVFAGFMFGPDLDIRSVQTKRWGGLRWIWRPYRQRLRHRSWLSHGFLAGTVVRLAYLSVWTLIGVLIVLEISNTGGHTDVTWAELKQSILEIFSGYWRFWVAIAIGLELGAMSHYTADWWVSASHRKRRRSKPKSKTHSSKPRR